MSSATTIAFVIAYIGWAYFIQRTSTWFYALFTSIIWGFALHAHVQLNIQPIMALVTGAAPFTEFASEWILRIMVFNLGGILLSVFYIWPVWGLNRAKWIVLILAAYPTPFILPIFIPAIILFHLFDFFIYGTIFSDQTIRQEFTHRGYGPEDYTLDS